MTLESHLIVLLRQKNTIKLLTQSAEKLICMGLWYEHMEIGRIYFLSFRKNSDIQIFQEVCLLLTKAAPEKVGQENFTRNKEKNECCLDFFFAKMIIIWPWTSSFRPGQTLIASPLLINRLQMMACWNGTTKRGLFLPIKQGQEKLQNSLLVQGKQTVLKKYIVFY